MGKCSNCNFEFPENYPRYHCMNSDKLYLCEDCYSKKKDSISSECYYLKEMDDTFTMRKKISKQPTISQELELAFKLFAKRPCFGTRESLSGEVLSNYTFITYEEVFQKIQSCGSGLLELLKEGELVGINGTNSPEWYITDFSCALYGLVSVPIQNYTESILEKLLQHTEIKCVFSDHTTNDIYAKIATKKVCPSLKYIIHIGYPKDFEFVEKSNPSVQWIPFLSFLSKPIVPPIHPNPDKLFTIIHTSGTTSLPKGAMLTGKVWKSRNDIVKDEFEPLIWLSFQPPAHLLDRKLVWYIIMNGGRVGFPSSRVNQILDDILALRPTVFVSTPRFYNFVYSECKEIAFMRKQKENLNDEQTEKIIEEEFRKRFGGRLKSLRATAAKVSDDLLEFLKTCFDCSVGNPYASTEADSIAGSSGKITPGVDFRIVDVPELGYFASDKPPRGELLVRSKNLFSGYYKIPSEGVFKNGYYCTGDIVELVQPNKIRVIDRKKNIVKLSQGIYIAPEELANFYNGSIYVDQIYIHANPLKEYVVAIVVPNSNFYREWYIKSGNTSNSPKEFTLEEKKRICEQKEMKSFLLSEFSAIAAKLELKPFEVPHGVILDPIRWTVESGKITPSGKVSRPHVERHYKAALDQLYEDLEVLLNDPNNLEGSTIQEKLFTLISRTLNITVNDENMNFSLKELGIDSLTAVSLVSQIQKVFNVKLPLQKLLEVPNVNALVLAVTDPSSLQSDKEMEAQLLKDSQLSSDIQTNICSPSPLLESNPDSNQLLAPKHILLTGVTGFLGIHLLYELLSQTSAVIHCLIRAKTLKEMENRFEQIKKESGLPFHNFKSSRIELHQGDFAVLDLKFGLVQKDYQRLSELVEMIYHSGAYVNHALPYSALKQANVIGTEAILRFAVHKKLKIVHFLSSVACITKDMFDKQTNKVYETTPLGIRGIASSMGYGMSKWVCEHLLHQAYERGIPVTIFRAGFISFQTHTGYSNPTDYLCRLVRAISHVNHYPSSNSMLDFSPVDYVASSIVRISLKPKSFGKTFHPVSPYHQVHLHEVVQALEKYLGRSINQFPTKDWLQLLRNDKTLPYGAILSHLFSQNEYNLTDFLDTTQFKENLGEKAYYNPQAKIDTEKLFNWFKFLLTKEPKVNDRVSAL